MTVDPERRRFLRTTGLALAGATVVACGGGSDDQSGDGDGTPTSIAVGTRTADLVAGEVDLLTALVRIEQTIVAAYQSLRQSRVADLEVVGAADAVLAFRDHHIDHAARLQGILTDQGVAEVDPAERFAGIELPSVEALAGMPTDELVPFARSLEDQAAQTYISTVPRLQLASLREAVMAIGAAQARHVVLCDILIGGAAAYATTAAAIIDGRYPTTSSLFNS